MYQLVNCQGRLMKCFKELCNESASHSQGVSILLVSSDLQKAWKLWKLGYILALLAISLRAEIFFLGLVCQQNQQFRSLWLLKQLFSPLFQGGWECTVRRNMLGKQQQFVNHIVRLMKEVSQFGGGRNKKVSLIEWDTRHINYDQFSAAQGCTN